jgi:general secretion pathway protein C
MSTLNFLLTKRNIFYLNSLLSIFLCISILFLARDIISNYFEDHVLKEEMPPPAAAGAAQQKKKLEDYAPILKNNPFGFPGGEIKPLTTAAAGNGSQQTDITLVGTVVGPKELSYGIFRDGSGMQEVFKIGETVFGLGSLSAVKRDKAILRKGAGSIEVPLEDVKVKEIAKQEPGGSRTSSTFARRVGSGTYVVDQARLRHAIANPGEIMTDARLRPIANGKEAGYVLSEVKPGGIYHSLGLQDGDVLLRINDYDISNPERALQAFTALKGLDRVQVDLIRSGSKMTLTYQIR